MSTLTKHQKINRTKYYTENGTRYRATVEIRHDDECGNGHNTFSITCDVYRYGKDGQLYEDSFGCQHDLVVRLWPELEPYIKWHLVSTDGPMHYVQNTLWHASDKDCWGKRKGEPTGFNLVIYVGESPISQTPGTEQFRKWLRGQWDAGVRIFDIESVHHPREPETFKPKYNFVGYKLDVIKWHEAPFDSWREADEWCRAMLAGLTFTEIPKGFSKGKEPDLDAARNSAAWPDATLEQLQDKSTLEARLPALLAEFQRDVESLGLVY